MKEKKKTVQEIDHELEMLRRVKAIMEWCLRILEGVE